MCNIYFIAPSLHDFFFFRLPSLTSFILFKLKYIFEEVVGGKKCNLDEISSAFSHGSHDGYSLIPLHSGQIRTQFSKVPHCCVCVTIKVRELKVRASAAPVSIPKIKDSA